jgi:hypothetical protein
MKKTVLTTMLNLGFVCLFSSMTKDEGKFKIFCFNKGVLSEEGFKLSQYDYDSTWQAFLTKADLSKASFVLDDSKIKNYTWENQELTISEDGFQELKEFEKSNRHLSHCKFIVVLNNKRIYSGEFLSYMSAMSVRHPVIHYDLGAMSKKTNTLRIFPEHSIEEYSFFPTKTRVITATEEIKNYFLGINKLK